MPPWEALVESWKRHVLTSPVSSQKNVGDTATSLAPFVGCESSTIDDVVVLFFRFRVGLGIAGGDRELLGLVVVAHVAIVRARHGQLREWPLDDDDGLLHQEHEPASFLVLHVPLHRESVNSLSLSPISSVM